MSSNLFTFINKFSLKFRKFLERIILLALISLIYFTVITPISIFIRLIGKDLLKTKFTKNNSYWIRKKKNIGSMRKQF